MPDSLKIALQKYANINEEDFKLADKYFVKRQWKKGEAVPMETNFGKILIYINSGLFRAYFIDQESAKEINTYFFQERQFMRSYLDFGIKESGHYFFEALEDSEVWTINQIEFDKLFDASHKWERFGRFLAEDYFRSAYKRMESFTYISPEERYIDLIDKFPNIFQRTTLVNISSYLGIERQSLSRIRKRVLKTKR